MKVHADVMAILTASRTEGGRLYLDGPRLAPKLYQRVNEVLEAAGGRWDRQAAAHLFQGDAAKAIAPVLASGRVTTVREARQRSQFFPTPAPVVARLIEIATPRQGATALEPSAGRGAIVAALAEAGCTVDCIEQDPGHAATLRDTGAARSVQEADFLAVPPTPTYDLVVMNPPFTRGADVTHVRHALEFLAPGGLLVAVMSQAVCTGTGEVARFRAMVKARGGTVEALPARSFASSGTDQATVIVTIPQRRPAAVPPLQWPIQDAAAPGQAGHRHPADIAADLAEALSIMEELVRDLATPITRREEPAQDTVATGATLLPGSASAPRASAPVERLPGCKDSSTQSVVQASSSAVSAALGLESAGQDAESADGQADPIAAYMLALPMF